jgi:hypothetical protein
VDLVQEVIDIPHVAREPVQAVDQHHVHTALPHLAEQFLEPLPRIALTGSNILADLGHLPLLHPHIVAAALLLPIQRIVVLGVLLSGRHAAVDEGAHGESLLWKRSVSSEGLLHFAPGIDPKAHGARLDE